MSDKMWFEGVEHGYFVLSKDDYNAIVKALAAMESDKACFAARTRLLYQYPQAMVRGGTR